MGEHFPLSRCRQAELPIQTSDLLDKVSRLVEFRSDLLRR